MRLNVYSASPLSLFLSLPFSPPPSLPPPLIPSLSFLSIEEDFVTWKEELWPSVCQQFGVDSSQQSGMVREYQLTVHEDLPKEKVFVGEPHRLGSYQNQKPYVLYYL
jgi:hypothetical protein